MYGPKILPYNCTVLYNQIVRADGVDRPGMLQAGMITMLLAFLVSPSLEAEHFQRQGVTLSIVVLHCGGINPKEVSRI